MTRAARAAGGQPGDGGRAAAGRDAAGYGDAEDGRATAGRGATPPERAPLPTRVDALPPLPEEFGRVVDAALASLDLELTPGMRAAIEAQARLLVAWNAHVNLTAIDDPGRIALEHVADSLAAVPPLLDLLAARRPPRRPVTLLDVGSGAGYPGLPVAVAIPAAHGALLESVGKKVAFLAAASGAARAALEAAGEDPLPIAPIHGRAEELARLPEQREHWDIVTARAVAPLASLVGLALPFVRPGGVLVAWKRDAGDGALEEEIAAAEAVLWELSIDPPSVERVPVDGLADHRLVLIRKRRSTPDRPRRRPASRHPLLR